MEPPLHPSPFLSLSSKGNGYRAGITARSLRSQGPRCKGAKRQGRDSSLWNEITARFASLPSPGPSF